MSMNNEETQLKEIICESIQDECIGHCNHPYCYKVDNIYNALTKKHFCLLPCSINDTVYFIGGIHNTLVKSAKVTEITMGDCQIVLHLCSENGVYFDMPSDEVYYKKEHAENYLRGREYGKRI